MRYKPVQSRVSAFSRTMSFDNDITLDYIHHISHTIFTQSYYQMSSTSLWWRHLVNACEVKAKVIGLLAKPCFWQPIPSGLNLVVAAVLRDSLCVVSLLPCVADCCRLYTVCKVERFVLTITKRRLLLFLTF